MRKGCRCSSKWVFLPSVVCTRGSRTLAQTTTLPCLQPILFSHTDSNTCVYLNTKNVIRAAGAQHIERGIHNGLVNRMRNRTQRQSPTRMRIALDYKMIWSMKIREKRLNFSIKRAICLDLE